MVKSLKMALFLGFLLWLVPFLVSMAIGPLRTSDRAFFETIMPVVITLAVMASTCYYFKDVRTGPLKEGAMVGALWFLISIVFDLFMFSWGPMAMTFTDYMKDIGLTYLIYPIVTIGVGYLLEKRDRPQA
jgi:EamA domain-containing membrane protein RarD